MQQCINFLVNATWCFMKLRQQPRHAAAAYLALLLQAGLVLERAFLPGSKQQTVELLQGCFKAGLGDLLALGAAEELSQNSCTCTRLPLTALS